MNDITALIESLKEPAKQAIELGHIKNYAKGRHAVLLFQSRATAANVLALVEALEKAQQRIAEMEKAASEPVAWVRYCSDGTIDGPLMNYQIEDCRKSTWTPLYTVPPEMESRTVTVKLPKAISVLHRRDFIDAHRAIYAYPEAELNAALAAAGIQVIEGEGQCGGDL